MRLTSKLTDCTILVLPKKSTLFHMLKLVECVVPRCILFQVDDIIEAIECGSCILAFEKFVSVRLSASLI